MLWFVFLFLHSFFLHFDWLVPFLTQQVVINTQIVAIFVQHQDSVSTRNCQQQFSRIYFDFRLSVIFVSLFVCFFVSLYSLHCLLTSTFSVVWWRWLCLVSCWWSQVLLSNNYFLSCRSKSFCTNMNFLFDLNFIQKLTQSKLGMSKCIVGTSCHSCSCCSWSCNFSHYFLCSVCWVCLFLYLCFVVVLYLYW
jgi:hypothetical protein